MTLARRVRVVALGVAVALLVLTGCVQVPSAGPVKKVPGQAEVCQNCVNVEVAPPAPGAEPGEVVEGYLRAMFNYQPGYTTAKQFLTTTAAAAWRPEDGVSIYRGAPRVEKNRVRLQGQLIGEIGKDRTYTSKDDALDRDLRLVRENGQWRIDNPPPGVLVSTLYFGRFWTGYSTYFVGNGSSLVPQRIYLPALRNPANIASALMIALLDGPSAWLAPAVDSAVPMGTELGVDSVTITNGIAEVQLNDTILSLPDLQRSLMAAQMVYTLRQVPTVKGLLITVNKQKFRVPGADPSLVIGMDTFSREIDPVPYVSDQLYAVKNGLVYQVTTPNEAAGLQPIAGPFGKKGRFAADSLAVSLNSTDVAVVANKRTALLRGTTANGDVTPLAEGLNNLLRPQFTRYGEVWAVGQRGGEQRLWRFTPSVADNTVTSSVFGGGEVIAFRISPDGVRMALVRQTATGQELGLARIVRADKVKVEGWRAIDLTQEDSPKLAGIDDVAWLDANELLVLGASAPDAAPVAVRVFADASRVTALGGEPTDWDADELTVLGRPQTVVVTGATGRVWRYNGSQWPPLLTDVATVAYAG